MTDETKNAIIKAVDNLYRHNKIHDIVDPNTDIEVYCMGCPFHDYWIEDPTDPDYGEGYEYEGLCSKHRLYYMCQKGNDENDGWA